MATRSSSSSSSSSESEIASGRVRDISEISRDTVQTGSRFRTGSPTNTIDGTSIADTTTLRSASPSASHTSAAVSRTAYDTVSIATTAYTGGTNATADSQQPLTAGGIPIIRPPALQQQQSGTGIGVFGPQRPAGYPTQPPTTVTGAVNQQPIKIDVASAQQQYQQRAAQPEISPYSGSTVSSSGESLSSPGNASLQQQQQQQQQQPRFDAAKALFTQANVNKDGSVSRDEFRQGTQGGINQSSGQFQQQQQAQFPNQIPAHQVYNELLGPDAFKDVILDIDYGAMGGFNVAFQSGSDFSGGQLPPGINIRPAYTTVDSLNYQQHMFNTARTINAGGENNSYDFGGASSSYNIGGTNTAYDVSGGQQFDVAKAIFNQADLNHDGSISRDEFRQWAQGSEQNYGGQSYSTTANYQTNTPNYSGNASNSFYQASLLAGADPTVANILQQSGIGQVVPHQ